MERAFQPREYRSAAFLLMASWAVPSVAALLGRGLMDLVDQWNNKAAMLVVAMLSGPAIRVFSARRLRKSGATGHSLIGFVLVELWLVMAALIGLLMGWIDQSGLPVRLLASAWVMVIALQVIVLARSAVRVCPVAADEFLPRAVPVSDAIASIAVVVALVECVFWLPRFGPAAALIVIAWTLTAIGRSAAIARVG